MNGIDIASYQADLNAGTIPADFVIIKTTEGTSYVNPTWQTQANQAKAAGKLIGFYHFASGGNATAEADHFITTIKSFINQAILVLDFEATAINAWKVAGAKTFLDRVKSQTGVAPLIYMSAAVTRQFDWSAVAGTYGLWVAQYADMNPTGYQSAPWTDGKGFGAWKNAVIHQYTSNLRLNGWNAGLDGDIAYLDRNGWAKYTNPSGQSAPSPTPQPSKPSGYSIAGKSLEQIANDTQAGKTGNGTARQVTLGKLYTGVMAIVNQRTKNITAEQAVQTLANEVKAGRYGNGDTRKHLLGTYFNPVQALINGTAQTTASRTYTVKSGDTLSGIGAKLGVNWQTLATNNGIKAPTYTIYPGQTLKY